MGKKGIVNYLRGKGKGRKAETNQNDFAINGAIPELYHKYERRVSNAFQSINDSKKSDCLKGNNNMESQLNVVINAANELVSIGNIPCSNPRWPLKYRRCVEALWKSCVAHHCSSQILKLIGGPEGYKLPDLTVPQLLALVAWIEIFRKQTEKAFPQTAKVHSPQSTYLDMRPCLFIGEEMSLVMDSAIKFLAWMNNLLWGVHRFAQTEFLLRTFDQTDTWLDNIYSATYTQNCSNDGKLTSSICEDVFSLVGVQFRTFQEHLSSSSESLVMALCMVFSVLRVKQIQYRDIFLHNLKSACTAANDFSRMSDKCEGVIARLKGECQFSDEMWNTLEESAFELVSLYSADAVYASQYVHIYIFEPIHHSIAHQLFGIKWEQDLTHNELALTIVRTIEDFLGDLEVYLQGDYLVLKTVDAIVAATTVFYIKYLVIKAETSSGFDNESKALDRVKGDIDLMKLFFDGLVSRMPSLRRVVESNFHILIAVHEIMAAAVEGSVNDSTNFIFVVHKYLGNVELTKHLFGDLWHLVAPSQERFVWELVGSMENDLEIFALNNKETTRKNKDQHQVPGLQLGTMLADLFLSSKRKLPIKSQAFKNLMKSLKLDQVVDDSIKVVSKIGVHVIDSGKHAIDSGKHVYKMGARVVDKTLLSQNVLLRSEIIEKSLSLRSEF